MPNYTQWFTETSNSRYRINSLKIYQDLACQIVDKLDNNLLVDEIITWIKIETIKAFKNSFNRKPEVGALNNAIGRWNELIATSLLSEIVIEINQQRKDPLVLVFSLPNSKVQKEDSNDAYSNFINLFKKTNNNGEEKLDKIIPFQNAIFLPSPDFVITVIDTKNISPVIIQLIEQQVVKPDSLGLYNFLKGKLNLSEVRAAISLKTSNRPDRRYQPLFEAAMIKAMASLLQQTWKYYMVASDISHTDTRIFNTAISPHGIAIEQNIKLVDNTYPYTKKQDLMPLVIDATN
ncbi:MAG: Cfr10I/Bse634I family restriction endonuclease [Calothrix sp. C42_A2020_038]|nr:Cfr10I/Bse634I family restriction endonuclease [Calothrix sp. C42_A2020_038]